MTAETDPSETPKGTLAGLGRNWKADLLSGFLVFLIALPLCLGISLASGYPAIAGIFTAILGGLLATFFSDSELTIKGPAAGLIVIALGAVTEFGYTAGQDPAADFQAYRLALGVGVAAGVIQILFGVFRAGILGEFFPTAAVHGLLAAIGVIIIAKQLPVSLGLSASGPPLELLGQIPYFVTHMNPAIGVIGIGGLLILFGYPYLPKKLRAIPGPMIVLIVAVPLGMVFGLDHEHTYRFAGNEYTLSHALLVNVPLSMVEAVTFPDFSGIATATGAKYIVLFSLIGSLESLLSAKAIDTIDPWKRKTNHDRDLLTVGVANTLASLVGGLPMISEIVRSKANIDNGGRTRFANMFHGLFLLLFVALVPGMINMIPLAALAAMLVYTGFRLASPAEFKHMFLLGKDQFVVFVSTILGVLATDLLVGIGIGILVQALLLLLSGAPPVSLFRLHATLDEGAPEGVVLSVRKAAVFSTWIPLRRRIVALAGREQVVVDLTEAKLVDYTVVVKLEEMIEEMGEKGTQLILRGLPERLAAQH